MTYLFDTNILVYAVDENEPAKRREALALLRRFGGSGQAVLTAQTLAEFANVTLRRLQPPLPPDQVHRFIQRYEQTFRVLPLTQAIVLEAVRGVRDHQLGYYDAQIWAAARLNQVPYVLSEDFNTGATLDGVTFLNPWDRSGTAMTTRCVRASSPRWSANSLTESISRRGTRHAGRSSRSSRGGTTRIVDTRPFLISPRLTEGWA